MFYKTLSSPENDAAEYEDLMGRFDPNNPEHVKRMKFLTGKLSGNKYTIGTEKDLEGKGIYSPSGEPLTGRYGFTVMESESEKRRRDPNSSEFKDRLAREQMRIKEDEWKRKVRMGMA